MRQFGLIGKKLSHSFSPRYFTQKFQDEQINASYRAYELAYIKELDYIFSQTPNLEGINVTIPFKQEIIPFLDQIDDAALQIGAVNCIKLIEGKKIGYNTDWIGFRDSLLPLLDKHTNYKAIIFGNGGAAQGIKYALSQLGIDYVIAERNSAAKLHYSQLNQEIADEHLLWINTTPVGMFPHINDRLPIPELKITTAHIFYDLIYNPEETTFLQYGKGHGAKIKNGLEMLYLQAEAGWKIWNEK